MKMRRRLAKKIVDHPWQYLSGRWIAAMRRLGNIDADDRQYGIMSFPWFFVMAGVKVNMTEEDEKLLVVALERYKPKGFLKHILRSCQ